MQCSVSAASEDLILLPGREVERNDGEVVPAGQAQRAPPAEGPEAGQPREAQEKL